MSNNQDNTDKAQNNNISNSTNNKPIHFTNNVYNYRNSKFEPHDQTTTRPSTPTDNNNSTTTRTPTARGSSLRDHFLAPLTDNSPRKDPSSSDTIKYAYASSLTTNPSPFTDIERSQTLDGFIKIFMNRIGDAISCGKLSKAWQRSNGDSTTTGSSWMTTDYSKIGTTNKDHQDIVDPKEYEAERDRIQPHLTPFVWGMSCSAITLFSLRVGKWYHGRKLGNGSVMRMRGVVSNTAKSITKESSGNNNNLRRNANSLQDLRHTRPKDYATYTETNPFQTKSNNNVASNHPSMENLLSLPVDISISILFGISTSIFLTTPSILMRDLSEAPLLPGKSVLSEELCGPFTEEMERVNANFHTYTIGIGNDSAEEQEPTQKDVVSFQEMWKDENLGEFDSLRAVRNFVVNCREREDRMKSDDNNDTY